MERLARALVGVLPVVAAAVGGGILAIAALTFADSAGFAYDFAAYDSAARRITDGQPLYRAGTVAAYQDGRYEGLYLYPPPLAVALTPVAFVDPETAAVAWFLGRLALLMVGCALLPVSRRTRLGTFAMSCISLPVLSDLNLGNVSVVIFALSALAWRLPDGPTAAVAYAALVALRFPFLSFFVLWAVQRRLRMISLTVTAGGVLFVATLLIVGWQPYRDYVTILVGLSGISTGPHNFSLKSLALAVGMPETVAGFGTLVSVLAGCAAIAYAGYRRDRDTAFVVTATATLLTAPFLHPHYLVVLLLPAALLVERGRFWGYLIPLAGWLPDTVLPMVALGAVLVALLPGASSRPGGPSQSGSYRWPHHPAHSTSG